VSRSIYLTAVVLFCAAFLTMAAVTLAWMYVPTRIIYRESSLRPTALYSVEVREHGQSYFLTPSQKATVDAVRYLTPRVWFGSAGIVVIALLAASAARLRMPGRPDAT
jgi:hypothetical protein